MGLFSILCLINFPSRSVLLQCNSPTHSRSHFKLLITLENRGCCTLLKDKDTKVYCGIVSEVTQPGVALLGIEFSFPGCKCKGHFTLHNFSCV